jgi:hypothetical protein
MALISTAILLMLMNIVDVAPYAYTNNYGNNIIYLEPIRKFIEHFVKVIMSL